MMSKDVRRDAHPRSKERESRELQKLLSLLSTPFSKQQLPALSKPSDEKSPSASPKGKQNSTTHAAKESDALDHFCSRFKNERNFHSGVHVSQFKQIFEKLVKLRLCSLEWNSRASQERLLRVLTCLRIFLRDSTYQAAFIGMQGLKHFTEKLKATTEQYMEYGEKEHTVEILREMTNVSQKLVAEAASREWIVACGLHQVLIMLLSCADVTVLHSTLYALIGLSQSERPRAVIGELNCIETMIRIIQDYDIVSKQLAINLLRSLCADVNVREQVKVFDGIPVLLSLLDSENIKLLWNVVWILVQLAADQDTRDEIRLLGGIPLLLSLLHDKNYVMERSAISIKSADMSRTPSMPLTEDASLEQRLSLKSAVCAAITELVLNDSNAQHIVAANGVHLLGMMIFPINAKTAEDSAAAANLQRSAFRALRFLFSMERNRQLFKRLLPPKLFERFIDVGHYKKDLDAYTSLVESFNNLQESEREEIKEKFEGINQNRAATTFIKQYAVFEHLGTGAFGSVYKVKKTGGQSFLALKEISILNPAFGKTKKEIDTSVGEILNECIIVREQLRHPNVVRYYKAFKEDDKLYIIMELIDGAPLGEHFNSLKEKCERFSEERLWNIFTQMVLGLRYIHKEKRIIHRDLTPNNIMLGENDKVTITDFGLSRQKQPDTSKMTSVVGTILYSCPEIIQNIPYSEKADVWALGCVFYQMATLQPPFFSANMLTLATKIVAADYDPLPDDFYSEKVEKAIRSCLTADPEERPDITGVAAIISDVLIGLVDKLKLQTSTLEKKLEKERRRTQKHYFEANRNMQNFHRLFLAQQEMSDRMSSLSTSNGGNSSLNSSKQDSDFENEEFDEKYLKLFPVETNLKSPTIDARFGSDILGTSEPDQRTSENELNKPGSGKFGSLERRRRNSRELSPLPVRRKTEDFVNKDDPADKDDVFVKPRPPAAGRKGARRPLPLDYNTQKPITDEKSPTVRNDERGDVKRTQSCSSLEAHQRVGAPGSGIWRPNSATATLSISPRKVRQINDPILQFLNQLHKIVYITQLPPPLTPNPQRRIIEQFKRSLFSPKSNSTNLKNEMKKLLEGSKELIDLDLVPGWRELISKTPSTLDTTSDTEVCNDTGITYEHLQSLIEGALLECGYYEIPQNTRQLQQPPLGPIRNHDMSHLNSGSSNL